MGSTSAIATQRSRASQRVRRSGKRLSPPKWTARVSGRQAVHRRVGRVELPRMEREHGRHAPVSKRALRLGEPRRRKHAKRPRAPEGKRSPEHATRQRRQLRDRPAVALDAVRSPGVVRAAERRHGHHRGVAPESRGGQLAEGGGSRRRGSTTRRRGTRSSRAARASSIDCRAPEQVLAKLGRGHLVGAAVQVAMDADLVARAARASRTRSG